MRRMMVLGEEQILQIISYLKTLEAPSEDAEQ